MPVLTPAPLAAALLLSIGDIALAQPKPPPTVVEDERLLAYVQPGQLVDIGGRRINLHCMGAGSPTVILIAGSGSWSPIWYKVQPVIAQKTRVCAFDRAGFGFSDPAPHFQILSDVVDDLHTALSAESIPEPYVLVGHSLGGIEVRLYAQRWPKQVAGMVLVDTSPAGEGLIEQNQPGFDAAYGGVASNTTPLLDCAFLAAKAPLDPSSPEHKDCIPTLPSDAPTAFRKIFPRFFTAYYFAERVSLMSSLDSHRYDSVDHRHLGAMAAGRPVAGDHMGIQHARRSPRQPILREGLDCHARGLGAPLLAWHTPDHQGIRSPHSVGQAAGGYRRGGRSTPRA